MLLGAANHLAEKSSPAARPEVTAATATEPTVRTNSGHDNHIVDRILVPHETSR